MPKFAITPHFRLHEWVAEEKGYFKAQGLEYEFHGIWEGPDLAKAHATPDKVGAYQSFEKGRDTNVSCACHWTVNVAASAGHGKLYADCYSVARPAFVRRNQIHTPRTCAACRSGRHQSISTTRASRARSVHPLARSKAVVRDWDTLFPP